jgi:hypothetical protein
MMSQLQQDVPGGHHCPNCGTYLSCHKRDLGHGRQRPLHEYGQNHKTVHLILSSQPLKWWTVRQLQGEIAYLKVVHAGRRSAWNYIAVQSVCSDLVGWEFVEMTKVPKSREWMYRWVKAKEASS